MSAVSVRFVYRVAVLHHVSVRSSTIRWFHTLFSSDPSRIIPDLKMLLVAPYFLCYRRAYPVCPPTINWVKTPWWQFYIGTSVLIQISRWMQVMQFYELRIFYFIFSYCCGRNTWTVWAQTQKVMPRKWRQRARAHTHYSGGRGRRVTWWHHSKRRAPVVERDVSTSGLS